MVGAAQANRLRLGIARQGCAGPVASGRPRLRQIYRLAPDDAYDDPDELRRWADLGLAAGRRAAAKKKPKKKKDTTGGGSKGNFTVEKEMDIQTRLASDANKANKGVKK